MKALVTGGSGFIGSHVVDKLRDHGLEVRVFDMVMPTFRDDLEFYHGSLLDHEAVRMAMSGIDVVYHLAAVADVKDVFQDPSYAESINVRGTINVLEAVRLSGGSVSRVIYGSTTWVYNGATPAQVDEDTPLQPPIHLYTATKIASEYYCQSYARMYEVPVTILRYGIPYGPRARDGAVVPIFVRKAMAGQPLTLAGDGSQFRKFIYVEDLADGHVLALKEIATNRIYNLDGTEQVTIKQIAELIGEAIGHVRIEHVPARPADFSGKDVSSERARRELGWQPKVPFRDGLRRYIAWYREREGQRQQAWDALHDSLKERGAASGRTVQ